MSFSVLPDRFDASLPVLLALALAGAALVVWWSAQRTVQPAAALPAAAPARYELRGAHWTQFDALGGVRVQVRAQRIEYFDDRSAQLTALALDARNGERAPWQINAPTATVAAGERRLRLLGPVEGSGQWPDGEALQFVTPELWVTPDASQLQTSAGVDLRSATRSGRADRLFADWAAGTLELNGAVQLEYGGR